MWKEGTVCITHWLTTCGSQCNSPWHDIIRFTHTAWTYGQDSQCVLAFRAAFLTTQSPGQVYLYQSLCFFYNRLFMVLHLVRAQSAYRDIRICSLHHTRTHTHTHTHTHTDACTHTPKHTHTHTHMYTHTLSLSLTHTHTHTHTHTPHTTNTCITGDGLVKWEENNSLVCRREEFSVLT